MKSSNIISIFCCTLFIITFGGCKKSVDIFNSVDDFKVDSISDEIIKLNENSLSLVTDPVEITESENLIIYTPNYSYIDLVCGKMPDKSNDSVIFCCAASYTAQCLDKFSHNNIMGDHITRGIKYKGAPSKTYKGAFTFYDGQPHFAYNDWKQDYINAQNNGGCGFAQDMMINEGKIVNYHRKPYSENIFRALCLLDNRLVIIDSKDKIKFRNFVNLLKDLGVEAAIYLDMGGWRHSWYRDAHGAAIDIFPFPNKYGTNWLTFYK